MHLTFTGTWGACKPILASSLDSDEVSNHLVPDQYPNLFDTDIFSKWKNKPLKHCFSLTLAITYSVLASCAYA